MERIVDPSEALLELGLSATATDEERAVVAASLQRAEGAARRYLHYDPMSQERTEYYPLVDAYPATGRTVWEVTDQQAVLREVSRAAGDLLQLCHLPVRSVASLYIDYDGRSGARSGSFGSETLKVEGTDFWPNYGSVDSGGVKVCKDGLLRSLGSWPTAPGCVKVTYTAGYTAAELRGQDSVLDASPIHEAVLVETCRRVRRMFAAKKRAGAGFVPGILSGERMGDYSYTVDTQSASQLSGAGELGNEAKAMLEPFVNYGIAMGG